MENCIKSFKAGSLEVYIFETREQMGKAACERYIRRAQEYITRHGKMRAIFAAAHSQVPGVSCLGQYAGLQ